ncbi:PIG-L deacetylase family protein [Caballeronia ptereochthonis]|uniref:LmbE family protein n=1 Tax=Caballeronia ptereochthonis TaxID=1777144 RepID=A0A158AG10_9BURK|nr:PIG-L family deacetylase [Caballeronia ptereochthonis]SAK56762.1 LmbE family protein [Caballeronia ptereochthonis]
MPRFSRRTIVISPHLDDAVFSCGAMLAASPGAVVCTVFTGAPRAALVTDWDTQCGFANAHQAMRARRAEDVAALEILGARAAHLGFLDSQYAQGRTNTAREIAAAIRNVIRECTCDTLFIPLGLFHSDHHLTHAAAREASLSDTSIACIAYEDCLYRRMNGLVQMRLAELANSDIEATPLPDPIDAEALACRATKQRAVQCYASQLKAFGPHGYDDVLSPERFWRLRTTDRNG